MTEKIKTIDAHQLTEQEEMLASQLTELLMAPSKTSRTQERRARSGRLDVRSAMKAELNDDDAVFKRTVTAIQNDKLHVILNVDTSYSQAPTTLELTESIASILVKALRDSDNFVDIVLFSNTAICATEVPKLPYTGITHLLPALKKDEDIFGVETGPRMVINIWDGQLSFENERNECMSWFENFHASGGISIGIHIKYTGSVGEASVIPVTDITELISELIDSPLLSDRELY